MNQIFKYFIGVLFMIILSNCSYQYYEPVNLELEMNSLTAHNLEEDGYLLSSGQDEIKLNYTIAALDANN